MNKTLYNAAMDKVTMSHECEERILEMTENIALDISVKAKRHFHLIPVLAAAAVLVTGTITAAAESGAFDWIKGIFTEKEFEITNDVTELIANMDNFTCTSNCGIEISPIGMIADESALYCMFNVDSIAEDIDWRCLGVNEFYTDKLPDSGWGIPENIAIGTKKDENGYAESFEGRKTITLTFSATEKKFSEGDKVNIRLGESRKYSEHDYGWSDNILGQDIENYADLSFNINFGNVGSIEKEYEGYNMVHIWNEKFFIKNLLITPLNVSLSGQNIYCDSINKDSDIKIIMKDNSVIKSGWSGLNGIYSVSGRCTTCQWTLDSPINVNNISAVYIGDFCLYDCNEQ